MFGPIVLPFIMLFAAVAASSLIWRLSYTELISLQHVPLSHQFILVSDGFKADLIALLLAIGLFLLIRLALDQTNGRWHGLLKWIRRLWALAVAAALCYLVPVRLLDYMHVRYSGSHIDLTVVKHFGTGLPLLTLEWDVTPVFMIALGSLVLILFLFRLFIRTLNSQNIRLSTAPLLSLLTAALLLTALKPASGFLPQMNDELLEKTYFKLKQVKLFPELQLIKLLWRLNTPLPPQDISSLTSEMKTKLARFGIFVRPDEQYPLIKNWVFKEPLPFASNNSAPSKPNIVFLFFESFSAALTSVYQPTQYPALTPHLERLSRNASVVNGFYNSSTPTVDAVKASLCSYLPPTEPSLWYMKKNYHKNFNCLPHMLQRRGYRTYALFGSDAGSQRYGEDLQNSGIQEIFDGTELKALSGEKPLSWGYSDHQLFAFLEHLLKKRKFKEPFFLMMETVDTHPPFNFAKDVEPYNYGDGTNRLLNTFSSTDHAFGEFWSYFENSKYLENTIVIAVGDHALFPGKLHRDTRKDDIQDRYFDQIMLIIRSPLHALPSQIRTISAQIDLAPSILHLLNINALNHFEGLSIFGERQRFPQLLAMHEYLFHTNQLVAGERVLDCFSLNGEKHLPAVGEECRDRGSNPALPFLSRCDYYDYYRWKSALHHQDRIWPN